LHILPAFKILQRKYNSIKALLLKANQTISSLQTTILFLETENKLLQEKFRLLQNGKKSTTSHTSPSHDLGRSNKTSLRGKTGKKTGGQKGHKGSTLLMIDKPDEVIDYKMEVCVNCSSNLSSELAVLTERKQEVDIPPVQVVSREHRAFTIICSCCEHKNIAALPVHLKAPIQYGKNVPVIISYFFAYQYMSYNRIKLAMRDLFNLTLSQGTIDNAIKTTALRAKHTYETIHASLQTSDVVGGDETGTKINGKKGWFHVWQNSTLTFIVAALTRGYSVTEMYFNTGFLAAVYVSDCWSGQLKTPAKKRQLCLAHLLRELTNFEEALNCDWSKKMKILLKKAISLKQTLQVSDYLHPSPLIKEIENEFTKMLEVDTTIFHAKTKAFVKRLIKHNQCVFTFLHYQAVPPDNNGSERAIRNVKVKTKVSGSFRSMEGATCFAILRSVIDTAIKNGQPVFSALSFVTTIPE
jgi:transposase